VFTKPCVMFSEGRRIGAKVQTCGRAAQRMFLDVRRMGILHQTRDEAARLLGSGFAYMPIPELQVPICEGCVDNFNWSEEYLFPLRKK
jgi:hypothetical protein